MRLATDYSALGSAVDAAAAAADTVIATAAAAVGTESDAQALSLFARNVAATARRRAEAVLVLQALVEDHTADQITLAAL